MWGLDVETVIQILFVVVIIGGALIQAIHRGMQKPVEEAERRRAEGGKDPSRALRDLLAELRGEARKEARPPEKEEEEGALYEEEPPPRVRVDVEPALEEEIPPPIRRPAAAPVHRPAFPRPPAPQAEAPQPAAPQPALKPVGAGEVERKMGSLQSSLPQEGRFKFAESRISSSLDDHVRATFAPSLQTEGPTGESAGARRAPQPLPGSTSPRNAILAQLFLGPPPALSQRRGGGSVPLGFTHFRRRRWHGAPSGTRAAEPGATGIGASGSGSAGAAPSRSAPPPGEPPRGEPPRRP